MAVAMQQASPPKDPESFRALIRLPDLVTAGTARVLYVSALVTPHWREAFDAVYNRDTAVPQLGWALQIEGIASAAQKSGIAPDVWTAVHQAFEQARFDDLPEGSLEESSTSFSEFSKKLHASIKSESRRLEPAKLAEVYLMAHQPTWPKLLGNVLQEARYDTTKVIRDFAQSNRVPDPQSLAMILSCMR